MNQLNQESSLMEFLKEIELSGKECERRLRETIHGLEG